MLVKSFSMHLSVFFLKLLVDFDCDSVRSLSLPSMTVTASFTLARPYVHLEIMVHLSYTCRTGKLRKTETTFILEAQLENTRDL